MLLEAMLSEMEENAVSVRIDADEACSRVRSPLRSRRCTPRFLPSAEVPREGRETHAALLTGLVLFAWP